MLQKIILKNSSLLDKISIGASAACAVHCVLLPLVFTTLPFLGIELMENIFLELATTGISLLIGGWAIWKGYKKHHRNKLILMLFIMGIVLLVTGNLFHAESIEMSLKFSGATLLITAHIYNWQKSRLCSNSKTPSKSLTNYDTTKLYRVERLH